MNGDIALLFGAFLALLLLGAPVALAVALGVGAYALSSGAMPPIVLVQTLMQGLDNTAFTAIPYFFLAGTIMNAGGMSERLLRLARAALSSFRGGLAHANIGASVVFAGVSGSAVADAAAVGSVMVPAMRREGYPGAYAAAVTAASATIGLIIPPSIPMVVLGLSIGIDVGDLFLAGIVPGLLTGVCLIATSALVAHRRGYPRSGWQGVGEVRAALRGCWLALLMPVMVVAGLVGGVATTAEIGAVAAVYAAAVTLWYRETGLAGLGAALAEAAVDSARVLIIIAVSAGLVWIIATSGTAAALGTALGALELDGRALLALLALTLLVLGTVLEPITLIVVVVPVLAPAAVAGGIDPLHFGLVAILASAIGLVTPPVGILIYVTAAQAGASALAVVRELAPFLVALCLLLAAVVALPGLVTMFVP